MEKEGLKQEQGVCTVTEVRMRHIREKMKKIKARAFTHVTYENQNQTPTHPHPTLHPIPCTPQIYPTCVEVTNRFLARLATSYTVGHVNCMASAPQGALLLLTAHCTLDNNPLVCPVGKFQQIAVNQIKGRQNTFTQLLYVATFEARPMN